MRFTAWLPRVDCRERACTDAGEAARAAAEAQSCTATAAGGIIELCYGPAVDAPRTLRYDRRPWKHMRELMPDESSPTLRARLIAVVDDDYRVLEALGDLLQSSGYHTTLHGTAESFLQTHERTDVDLVISDIGLPGISGLELLCTLRARAPMLPAILITGRTDAHIADDARALGVVVFAKPFDAVALLETVSRVLVG